MKEYDECSRCGCRLDKGMTKYIIYISIVSDLDGNINFEETGRMGDILDAVMDSSEEELEKDVYEEMAFLLCRRCKDRFRSDPLSVFHNQDDVHKINFFN
ncbi:MAG TPA: hypothetical protein VII00_07110 [bacterium]